MVQNLMAYSESPYKVVYQTDTYEIRYYEERLIVETQYSNQNNGFQKLFKYISGNNKQSQKIEMTTPVNVTEIENQFVMQFYLPKRFQQNEIPLPSDKSLKISTIESTLLELLPLLTGIPPSHSRKYFKGNLNNSFFPIKLTFFCLNKLLHQFYLLLQ